MQLYGANFRQRDAAAPVDEQMRGDPRVAQVLERRVERSVEAGRRGNAGKPVFSPLLIEWIGDAWMMASVDLGLAEIRSGVLIGAGAKILGNITIGEGAKVGAGSVVLKDVAPHTSVAGVPAVLIGQASVDAPALDMDHSL